MVRVVLAIMLGVGSFFLWFSGAPLWVELDVSLEEQKGIAILIWIVATVLLLPRRPKNVERKSFSILVKREVIRKQKAKCAKCKRNLEDYSHDFDHRNGDRSKIDLTTNSLIVKHCVLHATVKNIFELQEHKNLIVISLLYYYTISYLSLVIIPFRTTQKLNPYQLT